MVGVVCVCGACVGGVPRPSSQPISKTTPVLVHSLPVPGLSGTRSPKSRLMGFRGGEQQH